MKKALIIGGAGFVGKYLAEQIQHNSNWSINITKMQQEQISMPNVKIYDLDILNYKQVKNILDEVKPDYIFHLAAQSSVALSWKNPQLTVDVNIKGSLNLLEALRNLDYKPRVLLIGSGEEYGRIKEEESPITEENILRPGNIYAATKVCQNIIGKIYADAYDLDIISVRAFNHIGPGQCESFVVSDFCKQVAEIEAGKREAVIKVGNINVKRDFTDVRDVVRAYSSLIEKGIKGETYNVGSGKAQSIKNILKMIIAQSTTKKIEIFIDPKKIRPVDVPIINADISKLKQDIFWNSLIPTETTIAQTLEYWRDKLNGDS